MRIQQVQSKQNPQFGTGFVNIKTQDIRKLGEEGRRQVQGLIRKGLDVFEDKGFQGFHNKQEIMKGSSSGAEPAKEVFLSIDKIAVNITYPDTDLNKVAKETADTEEFKALIPNTMSFVETNPDKISSLKFQQQVWIENPDMDWRTDV